MSIHNSPNANARGAQPGVVELDGLRQWALPPVVSIAADEVARMSEPWSRHVDCQASLVQVEILPAGAHGASQSWTGTRQTYQQGLQRILAMAFSDDPARNASAVPRT